MYENNIDNFIFKPLTLYNFFPNNKRLKNSNQDSNSNLNHNHHLGYTNNARANIKKNFSNSKYNYKIVQNSKNLKFNKFASSTSNNFYHNHNHNKYSINNDNKNKYVFRKYRQKKNKTKDKDINKRQEIIGDVNFHYFQKYR